MGRYLGGIGLSAAPATQFQLLIQYHVVDDGSDNCGASAAAAVVGSVQSVAKVI